MLFYDCDCEGNVDFGVGSVDIVLISFKLNDDIEGGLWIRELLLRCLKLKCAGVNSKYVAWCLAGSHLALSGLGNMVIGQMVCAGGEGFFFFGSILRYLYLEDVYYVENSKLDVLLFPNCKGDSVVSE